MKAFDMLKALHSIDIRKGKDYIRTAKENGYSLDILQGKLKPKHWYFVDFHEKLALGHPDVILTMGSNEKQYFYELEKKLLWKRTINQEETNSSRRTN